MKKCNPSGLRFCAQVLDVPLFWLRVQKDLGSIRVAPFETGLRSAGSKCATRIGPRAWRNRRQKSGTSRSMS